MQFPQFVGARRIAPSDFQPEQVPNQGKLTTSSTSQLLIPERFVGGTGMRRSIWYVANTDTTNGAWLGLGTPARVGYGLYVGPNNGSFIDSDSQGYFCSQLEINAIANAGTPALNFFERLVS